MTNRGHIIFQAMHHYYHGQNLEPTDERLRELGQYIDSQLTAAGYPEAVETGKTITITIR